MKSPAILVTRCGCKREVDIDLSPAEMYVGYAHVMPLNRGNVPPFGKVSEPIGETRLFRWMGETEYRPFGMLFILREEGGQ